MVVDTELSMEPKQQPVEFLSSRPQDVAKFERDPYVFVIFFRSEYFRGGVKKKSGYKCTCSIFFS